MPLLNYTEIAVRQCIEQLPPQTDICRCEDCVLDVIALSLNKLKPHYVVTEKGVLFMQLKGFDAQYNIDIMTAVTEAIDKVRSNSRHGNCKPLENT